MTRLRHLRALFAVLAASLMLSACDFDVYQLPLPGGTDTGENPISVEAEFRDVLDLVPKSTVKVNDVSVGKVTDIELEGQHAVVSMELASDVELPANALAEIRQTSLLGEKFVSLSPPETGASSEPLESGDVIDLDSTGRNPEVEEVLGALSLLLNGGGVAQLKTIAQELNLALEGREDSARSVLHQIEELMGQLDANKGDIVDAIEALNRLSIAVNDQIGSIDLALDEMPSALRSLDQQRDDLVKMLQALNRLGDVGVEVIRASKDSTIRSFQHLVPVLTQLGNAGDDFANAFHVFLTYPFVDEVVGRDPQVARNLHMGDYTNLSIRMNVTLTDPDDTIPDPDDVCTILPGDLPDLPVLPDLDDPELCEGAADLIQACLDDPRPGNPACEGILGLVLDQICAETPASPLCETVDPPTETLSQLEKCLKKQNPDAKACEKFTLKELRAACKKKKYKKEPLCQVLNALPLGGGGGNGGGDGGILDGVLRPGFGPTATRREARGPTMGELMEMYDPSLVTLLVPGMVVTR